MNPKTRQTFIGVTGQTTILAVGLSQGINGPTMVAGAVVIGLTATGHLIEGVEKWSSR